MGTGEAGRPTPGGARSKAPLTPHPQCTRGMGRGGRSPGREHPRASAGGIRARLHDVQRDPANVIGIYGGQDPAEIPTYTLTDVSRYLRIARSTLAGWAGKKTYRVKGPDGTHAMQPLFFLDAKTNLLTFNNFVEAYVLTSFTREVGIRLPRVRDALEYAGGARPLLHNIWKTDGRELFIDTMDNLVNVSLRGQLMIREAVENSLKRIEFDPSRRPLRFSPWRDTIDEPRSVDVDPRRAFGRPTVVGSSLKVDTVLDLLRAGESPKRIARNYDLKADTVKAVARWGEDAKAAA